MTPEEIEAHVLQVVRGQRYSNDEICRSVVRAFNQIYYGSHGASQPWFKNTWMGVPILKCPEDLFIYQEIIHRTQPTMIIETGIAYGGSTLFLAQMLELMGDGRVIAIDITLENVHRRQRHPRAVFIEGDSVGLAPTVSKMIRYSKDERVMVILDSDHSEAHVRAELEAYAPLVTPGCYLIVEDSNVNGHPVAPEHGPGPYEAVEDFLAGNSSFERDVDAERLLLTFNTGGYLRRK